MVDLGCGASDPARSKGEGPGGMVEGASTSPSLTPPSAAAEHKAGEVRRRGLCQQRRVVTRHVR
jgi:hypothetical protein